MKLNRIWSMEPCFMKPKTGVLATIFSIRYLPILTHFSFLAGFIQFARGVTVYLHRASLTRSTILS